MLVVAAIAAAAAAAAATVTIRAVGRGGSVPVGLSGGCDGGRGWRE